MALKKSSNIAQRIFFIASIVVFFLVVFFIPRLSVPMALAYILSLVVRPILPLMFRMGIKRKYSIFIMFLCFFFFFIYPAMKVAPVLEEEMANVQNYFPRVEIILKEKIQNLKFEVKERTGYTIKDPALQNVTEGIKNTTQKFLFEIPHLITSLLEWFFLIPVFLYFFLQEGKTFKRAFLTILPNKYFEKIYFMVHQFDKKIGGYIFAKFVEANLVGLLIGFGLFFLGFPFASLLGFLAGFTNVIPYLGPLLGLAPTLIVLLVAPEYSHLAGPVLILYLVANLIDMVLIFPILVSRIVNLHPIIVIVSVIIGSQLMGVVGMVISVPVANIIKLLIGEIYRELFPQSLKNE